MIWSALFLFGATGVVFGVNGMGWSEKKRIWSDIKVVGNCFLKSKQYNK